MSDISLKKADKKEENNFKIFLKNYILPFMHKIANNKHLALIRDSFGTFLPVILCGSICMLLDALLFASGGTNARMSLIGWIYHWNSGLSIDAVSTALQADTNGWGHVSHIGDYILNGIANATVYSISIYIAVIVGYLVGQMRKIKYPILCSLATLSIFLIIFINQIDWAKSANGLLATLIFCISGAELYCYFEKQERLKIRLPEGVPPAIAGSFSVLVPFFFIFIIFGLADAIFLIPAMYAAHWQVTSSGAVQISASIGSKGFLNWFETTAGKSKDNPYWFINPSYNPTMTSTVITNFMSSIKAGQISYTNYNEINNFLTSIFTNTGSGFGFNFFQYLHGEYLVEAGISSKNNDLINQGTQLCTTMQQAMQQALGNMTHAQQTQLVLFIQYLNDPTTVIDYHTIANLNSGFEANLTPGVVSGLPIFVLSGSYKLLQVNSSSFGIGEVVYFFIATPLMSIVKGNTGYGILLFVCFICMFLWFFGVHGTNVLQGIFLPILMPFTIQNMLLFKMYGDAAFTEHGNQMWWIAIEYATGGAGNVFALAILGRILSRRRSMKEITKYAIPCTTFNISEPLIFGLPLVLNWVYFVPFVFGFLPATIPTFFLKYLTHWAPCSVYMVPWAAPPIIYDFLGTLNPKSILIGILSLIIEFGYWFPFVLIDNKMYMKELKINDKDLYEKQVRYYSDLVYKLEVDYEDKKNNLEDKRVTRLVGNKKLQKYFQSLLTSKSAKYDVMLEDPQNKVTPEKIESIKSKSTSYYTNKIDKLKAKYVNTEGLFVKKAENLDKWYQNKLPVIVEKQKHREQMKIAKEKAKQERLENKN